MNSLVIGNDGLVWVNASIASNYFQIMQGFIHIWDDYEGFEVFGEKAVPCEIFDENDKKIAAKAVPLPIQVEDNEKVVVANYLSYGYAVAVAVDYFTSSNLNKFQEDGTLFWGYASKELSTEDPFFLHKEEAGFWRTDLDNDIFQAHYPAPGEIYPEPKLWQTGASCASRLKCDVRKPRRRANYSPEHSYSGKSALEIQAEMLDDLVSW